jgi:hypothetical protein
MPRYPSPEMVLTIAVSAAREHGDGRTFETKQLDWPEEVIVCQLEDLRDRGLIAWKRHFPVMQVTEDGILYEASAQAQALVGAR